MKKLKKILSNPKLIVIYLMDKNKLKWLSDKKAIQFRYNYLLRKKINFDNPQTFNEKLNWLKLFDRKDIYTKMADKYEVKKIVSDKIGSEYVIPMLGIYNKFDEIDFDKLPNQFVIKCTHDSGGLVIVKDKSKLDINSVKNLINNSLKYNYFYKCREWPYKNIKPRILIEEFIKDDTSDDLRDYKFLCFNGEPKYVYVTVKNDNIWENYYDIDFNPITWINHGFPRYENEFIKPKNFDKMVEIARIMSKDIPFLRVDLHNINGRILFGENTFYDWAGFRQFDDEKIDIKLGQMLNLEGIM